METAGRYRRYIRYLFALVSFSFLSAFFLDNIFSDRAEAGGLARSVAQFRVEARAEDTSSVVPSQAPAQARQAGIADMRRAMTVPRREPALAAGPGEEWKEF